MKKPNLKNICAWGFGSIFGLLGFAALASSDILSGLFLVLLSVTLLPPTWKFIQSKSPFQINTIGKSIAVGFLVIAAIAFIPPSESSTKTVQSVDESIEVSVIPEEEKEVSTSTSTEDELENAEPASETTSNDINPQKTSVAEPDESPKITQTSTPSDDNTYYSVTDIVDGDTIKISMDGSEETLRLIGIDTPETVDPRKPVQCFGKEASNKAKELLSGQRVRIEADPTQDTRDKYGRLLAYVYRDDGLFFNKTMIEQGYAYEYTYDVPYKFQSEFKTAEQTAKTNQRGLWSSSTCNGDPNTGVQAEEEQETEQTTQATPPTETTSSGGKFYTSSHHTAKYWYPESCDGWEGLSPTYLKSFNTLEELLAQYSRTKNPNCD